MSTDRTDAERLAGAVAKGMQDSRIAATQAGEDMEFLRHQITRLQQERDAATREAASERESRQKLQAALRQKDEAMGVLFARLKTAGVDCSDLIP